MAGRFRCARAENAGDRRLGVADALDKGRAAMELPRPFVAIGDGSTDIPLLRAADLAIAFAGCRRPSQEVLRAADIVIDDENSLCDLLEQLI